MDKKTIHKMILQFACHHSMFNMFNVLSNDPLTQLIISEDRNLLVLFHSFCIRFYIRNANTKDILLDNLENILQSLQSLQPFTTQNIGLIQNEIKIQAILKCNKSKNEKLDLIRLHFPKNNNLKHVFTTIITYQITKKHFSHSSFFIKHTYNSMSKQLNKLLHEMKSKYFSNVKDEIYEHSKKTLLTSQQKIKTKITHRSHETKITPRYTGGNDISSGPIYSKFNHFAVQPHYYNPMARVGGRYMQPNTLYLSEDVSISTIIESITADADVLCLKITNNKMSSLQNNITNFLNKLSEVPKITSQLVSIIIGDS
eukprot:156988_1